MADEKLVKARVLVALSHEGTHHKPDSVITGSASVIKGLAGSVDSHEDAVGYAEGLAAKAKAKAAAEAEA